MKESLIIKLLQTRCPHNASIKVGIGDDSAVLHNSRMEQLICSDMLMEGVHFKLADASPEQIGHKALAVNLSDIAAMGGSAQSAFICLALPHSLAEPSFIDRLYAGFENLAHQFQVSLAGGDTNIWDGPLVIAVTALGTIHPKGAILRSGAQIGDQIFVTGPLGGSILGHHLSFTPRLTEVKKLMDSFTLHSMIDLSDGLGKDLRDLCSQSGVAAYLAPNSLPLRPHLASLPLAQGLEHAMGDGEDFELCFTLSSTEAQRLKQNPDFQACRHIGRISEGQGLHWQLANDQSQSIANSGYEHHSKETKT